MTPRSRSAFLGFLILLVMALGFFLVASVWRRQMPTDAEVLARFRQHRPVLERLAGRMQEDPWLGEVRPQGAWLGDAKAPSPGLARPKLGETRFKAYVDDLVQSESWLAARYQDRLTFPFAGRGWGDEAWRMGFILDPAPHESQVPTIDGLRRRSLPQRTAVRKLDGNWYVWATW